MSFPYPKPFAGPTCILTAYSAEAQQFFDRTSGLTVTQKVRINTLVNSLKTAGIWAKLDGLYLVAGTGSKANAKVNLISSSYPLTEAGTPTYTTDSTFSGSGRLDTGYDVSTNPGLFKQNSASMFIWSADWDSSNGAAMGAGTGGLFQYINYGTVDYGAINAQDNSGQWSPSNTNDSIGLWHSNRSASNAEQLYRNGVQRTSNSTASFDYISSNTLSFGGIGTDYMTKLHRAYGFGQSLNSTEAAALYTALLTYMDSWSHSYYHIGDIRMWLDFSNAAKVTTVSGNISAVTDQSGWNSNLMVQTTAGSRPAYITAAQNGLNVARFDGVDDFLFSSGGIWGFDGGNATCFVVAKYNVTTAQYFTDASSASGGANRMACAVRLNANNGAPSMYSGNTLEAAADQSGAWHVFTYRFGNVYTSASQIYVDGTQVASGDAGTQSMSTLNIGGRWNTANGAGVGALNGDIGELLFFNSWLSDPARQFLEAYLKSKWGTP